MYIYIYTVCIYIYVGSIDQLAWLAVSFNPWSVDTITEHIYMIISMKGDLPSNESGITICLFP